MNMIMDSVLQQHQQQLQQLQQHQNSAQISPPTSPVQHIDLQASETPPMPPIPSPILSNNNNNNNVCNKIPQISTKAGSMGAAALPVAGNTKATLKRSFDVAFLMMPDERIKQKQQQHHLEYLAKQPRRSSSSPDIINVDGSQYPTDLSPRSQLTLQSQQSPAPATPNSHSSITPPMDSFSIQHEAATRRYTPQIGLRSPRIYDDPTVVIPAVAASGALIDHDALPLKSAFTKVTAAIAASASRLESPVPPPLSPDQVSCSSLSPPITTTPPRTNSNGNGSLSNGSNNSGQVCLNPNIVYQSFRPPEYQFNGAFQSPMHAMQAQRLKQQLLYRPPLTAANIITSVGGPTLNTSGLTNTISGAPPPPPPPDFLPAYPGFPFPAGAPFAAVGPPELPRIVQNPAAAAILSTLIPPTLASTFSLTAQNVCAKCNISFRMTSDLVYHMRSHHKSEVACDPNRRKREEKLKCPVCQESFRERHHLTRHMTAHQDKESDQMPQHSGNSNSNHNSNSHSSSNHHNSNINGSNANSSNNNNDVIITNDVILNGSTRHHSHNSNQHQQLHHHQHIPHLHQHNQHHLHHAQQQPHHSHSHGHQATARIASMSK